LTSIPGYRFCKKTLPEQVQTILSKKYCPTVVGGYVISDEQTGMDPQVKITRSAIFAPRKKLPLSFPALPEKWTGQFKSIANYFRPAQQA